MDENKIKEEIQIGYLSALCASVGITFETQQRDDDSTDAIIKKRLFFDNGCFYDAQLRVQLKCTSSASQYHENKNEITYKLKSKNYNDLCAACTTPIILGLLILPESEKEWVTWSQEELLIKGRMYWASFSNCNPTSNKSSVSVKLSKLNIVSPDSLNVIINKIAKEEII